MVRVEERWSCRQDALRRVYLCGDHCEDFARDPKTSNQLNESFPMSPHTPPNSHRELDYTLGPSGWGPLTLAIAFFRHLPQIWFTPCPRYIVTFASKCRDTADMS